MENCKANKKIGVFTVTYLEKNGSVIRDCFFFNPNN